MAKPTKQQKAQMAQYNRFREHIGHSIACVCYGKDGEDPYNVAIECEDCGFVITDVNHPGVGMEG